MDCFSIPVMYYSFSGFKEAALVLQLPFVVPCKPARGWAESYHYGGRMKNWILIITSTVFLLISQQSAASLTISDPATDTVHLKTDCSGVSNCATTMNELITWIWSVRQPSSSSPLLVKIGTGEFAYFSSNPFTGGFCSSGGHVTFLGSGKGNTRINNQSTFNGISIQDCHNLVFQDLTFDFADTVYGIFWKGGGSSSFNNIELIGGGTAWYDEGCGDEKQVHYFIGSQVRAKSYLYGLTSAYFTRCAETWFIGSEIVGESDGTPVHTIFAEGDPEVHVYGSSLRALSAPGIDITSADGLAAVSARNGSNVHIHGTGIDVISADANNVTALRASNGGHIHANQSSFVLETGIGGSKTRLANNGGHIVSPYLWGDVDVTSGVTSIHGADISVSTDTTDGQPHILIYSDNCASNWFDSTANQCRP